MKIAPISMVSVSKSNTASFKGQQNKPIVEITDDMSDDTIVSYGSWGPNYVYPITAGQIRTNMAESLVKSQAHKSSVQESEEEYQKRKLYSTEWCM